MPYYKLIKVLDENGKQKSLGLFNRKEISGTPHGSLTIKKKHVSFFNSKANTIVLIAENNENITFISNSHSVPIRHFNIYGSTVTAKNKKHESITIYYNDVFNYEPDQYYNYSVGNNQYDLK